MIKEIKAKDDVVAYIIPRSFRKEGIEFVTPNNFSQQLGYMKRPAGYLIEPHVHKLVVREIKYTQETIVVRSGRIRVDLFDNDKHYIESVELTEGDVILLASGGHGFEFLEESELIEIKQGPYISFEVDKERFENPKHLRTT